MDNISINTETLESPADTSNSPVNNHPSSIQRLISRSVSSSSTPALPLTPPRSVLLSVYCLGLNLAKTTFSGIGSLSKLYVLATNPTVKNEKRYIKISQSDPFRINGRPSK